jgi:hypothetical protein
MSHPARGPALAGIDGTANGCGVPTSHCLLMGTVAEAMS